MLMQDCFGKTKELELPQINFEQASRLWVKRTGGSGSRSKTACVPQQLRNFKSAQEEPLDEMIVGAQLLEALAQACPSTACTRGVTQDYPLVGDDVWVNFTDRWLQARVEGRSGNTAYSAMPVLLFTLFSIGRKHAGLLHLWFYVDGETEELAAKEVREDVWPVMQGSLEVVAHTAADGETLAELAESLGTNVKFLVELNRKRYKHITPSAKLVRGSSLLVAIAHENQDLLEAHSQEEANKAEIADQKRLAKEKRKQEAATLRELGREQEPTELAAATKAITESKSVARTPKKRKHVVNRKYTEQSPEVVEQHKTVQPAAATEKFGKARILDPKNAFHASSHSVIDPSRTQDSEDEMDEQWIDDEDSVLLGDFVDVTASDKKFMRLWNHFKLESLSMVGDAALQSHIFDFIAQHHDLLSGELRDSFIRHLLSIYEFALIDPEIMCRAVELVQPSDHITAPISNTDDSKQLRPTRRRKREHLN